MITLNVNGLSYPNQRHRVTEWVKNQNRQTKKRPNYAAYQIHTSALRTQIALKF